MTDKIAEIDPHVQIAAFKANQELGDVRVSKGKTEEHLLSTRIAEPILNKYEESEIHRENSIRDPLTGLLNRRGLVEGYNVSMRVREREGLIGNNAIVALDLIGLKKLNKQLSPDVADQILQSAGEHLMRTVREIDLVGRWGGDEALLVLFGINKRDVEKLVGEINRNLPDHVHFNIGYEVIEPSRDAFESMKRVMDAMEDVKKMGGLDETGRALGTGIVVDIDALKENV